MKKDFDSWNFKKKQIEEKMFSDYIHVREVWWCSLGINIGSEQDGKNEFFERPVLVIRKFNKDTVLAAPITSKVNDNPYHKIFFYKGLERAVIISQIRMISTKRLTRYIHIMDSRTFDEIREAIRSII